MKRSNIVIFLILFSFCPNGCAWQKGKTLNSPFFAFSNALHNREIPIEEQALILKKYGFDGIEHIGIAGILEKKNALEKQGLKIYADYVEIDIDQKEPYLPEWKETIPKLAGSGIILWVHIHSVKYKPSDEAADKVVVPILQELANFAKPYGVHVAIYHHVGFLAQKAEDSYRLAQKVNRENVGSVFNLCHFLKTDSEKNLEKVIDLTFPKLFAVSICGADSGDTRNMEWERLIQPLGQGTFDVYHVVEMLADKGFKGPIGLQCYNLGGDPETYLSQSSKTWESFKQRYSSHMSHLQPGKVKIDDL